jgi:hypothetical protein
MPDDYHSLTAPLHDRTTATTAPQGKRQKNHEKVTK